MKAKLFLLLNGYYHQLNILPGAVLYQNQMKSQRMLKEKNDKE
jgi:hypothetical protein